MMVILGDDDGIGNYKCKVFLRRCYTKQLCFRKEKQFQDCIAKDVTVTPSNMFHATCNDHY